MKPWIKWALALALLALVAGGALRALSQRKAQQTQLQEQTQRQQQTVIELQTSDLWTAKTQDLNQSLALTGTIKAVRSAVVKARVAGELQGLVVREGDTVQAGALLAQIDPTEYAARLQQAQLQADAAKTQVEIAQRAFDNNQALVKQWFISATALDTSAASLAGAQASYRAALAGADVARKALEDTHLRAPLAGLVSQRLAQPGERVSVDARIVEIVDLARLELEATVTPAESVAVRIGQTAQITVEGMTQAVKASVVRINPSTSAGSRAVTVYLALDPTPGLRHGLYAQGALQLGSQQGLAVPLTAVRTDKPAPYVQVLSNGTVAHANVTLGSRSEVDGQTLVAVTGLAEGSQVLVASVGAVRAGTPVKMAGVR